MKATIPKYKIGAVVQGKSLPVIPKEYQNLRDVFSKRVLDELALLRPTDYAISILPGAKVPKLKLYSTTSRELEEL